MRNDGNNFRALLIGILLLSETFIHIYSQSGNILDNYIKTGLNNNLALQQKELNLEKCLKALKEANGLFYPSIGLEASYTSAKGGRSIDFPIGTLLNPVYSTLNDMLRNMGQQGSFPQLEDQTITFLPNDYHDTKLRMIMPLINAEIYFNRKIRKEMISAAQAEINVYRRELIKEIKTAYFRHLQASKIVDAYNSALLLVNEARRVNMKLVENQMAGPEKLYRIEAERGSVSALLTKAENDLKISASYFNFLLNQPLQNPVELDSIFMNEQSDILYINSITHGNREEISQLNSAINSSRYFFRMKNSSVIPVITNITDLGFQGYSYSFDNEQQYVMNTITLSWPLFNGWHNRNKTAQARIGYETLKKQLDETELQIELQCKMAEGNLLSSIKSEEANKASMISSAEYYKVISRQYATGQKALLDLLDARNQLTSSEINFLIAHYDTLIRKAELERANASIDLEYYFN